MKLKGKHMMMAPIAIITLSLSAQAGSVLRLNSGAVNTAQLSKTLSSTWRNEVQQTEYIVQFKNAVTEFDKKALRAAKLEVFGYLPDDALVVRATFSQLNQFKAVHPGVQAIVKYEASYKIARDFEAASVFNKENLTSVLVKTFKASDADVVSAKMAALNPQVTLQIVDGKSIVALIPRGLVPAVAGISGVEHVQPTPQMESFHVILDEGSSPAQPSAAGDYTDLKGDESGTSVMKFDSAWALGFTGRDQIVSMADTGLDSGDVNTMHKDFAGGVITGYAFGLWAKTWDDPMGHGTHVAGSVLGRGTASNGLLKGGAYDAKMVAEGMWSPMLNNLSVPSKLSDLFAKAHADGARLHTNSWGGARTFGAYDAFATQVDEWSYANPDMLILFAAGNSGSDKNKDGRIDANTMASPGTAKNVLTVGASENVTKSGGIQVPISKLRAAKDEWAADPINSDYISNNENGVAMFSSRGPTADGRTKPDIVAPGTNILSVRSQVKGASELWGAYNADYAWSGGTSMATPLTAGAAAIARQVLVEKIGVANPSAALMKATMIHTAVDMFPGQFGEVGAARGQELLTRRPNSDEGYGRVDVSAIADLGSQTIFVDNTTGIAQGAEASYTFNVGNNGSIYANLVWTDAPGSSNAAFALVNDLDLVLTTPAGQQISMNDHLNNLEMIELSNLTTGTYKLTVKGYKIPQGKNGLQSFALVYTAK